MIENEKDLRQKEREALRVIAVKLGISEEEALRQAIQIMENQIAIEEALRRAIAAKLGLRAAEVDAKAGSWRKLGRSGESGGVHPVRPAQPRDGRVPARPRNWG